MPEEEKSVGGSVYVCSPGFFFFFCRHEGEDAGDEAGGGRQTESRECD